MQWGSQESRILLQHIFYVTRKDMHHYACVEACKRILFVFNGIINTIIFLLHTLLEHSLIIHEAEALILSPTLGSQNC